ncbi:hypothetical protein ACEQ8H_002558 [Pleosporales sp. CAS-2024a]
MHSPHAVAACARPPDSHGGTTQSITTAGYPQSITTPWYPQSITTPWYPQSITTPWYPRCNISSKLAQSPARQGHAVRMRNMFNDASDADQYHRSATLYPQLPNISRKTLPTSPSKYRPESLCLPTNSPVPHPPASLVYPSDGFSESWSDDSAYIVTTRAPSHGSAVPSDERIRIWLEDLPHCDMPVSNGHDFHDAESERGPRRIPLHELTDTYRAYRYNANRLNSIHLTSLNQDQTPAPRNCNTDEQGHGPPDDTHPFADMDLSPLSPHVCIHRGPSRYHSRRDFSEDSDMATPSKHPHAVDMQPPRHKGESSLTR